MAKKKKTGSSRKQKASSLDALSAEELREKGDLFLRQEKYRDAIFCFKQLLKQEENEDTLQALAQAYTGRIESLAAKSMIKEAMALLETMVQRYPNARVDSLRLSLLLQSGSFAEAVRFFRRCRSQLERNRLKRLEVLFGALLLAGVGLRPEDFDEDSPVVCHYPLALEAMELFFNKQESEVHDTLKRIPFRSPYRDLRMLLTGLLILQQDKEKACVVLGKIEKDSPYFQYAGRYLTAADTPKAFLQNLAATPKRDHQLIRDQYNLNHLQLRALDDLSHSDSKPLNLCHLVGRHGPCFDKKQRIGLLKNILPFCREHAMDVLIRYPEFDLLEKYRICALAAEKDGAFTFAVEFWSDYLGESDRRDPANFKEIALVIRYQAKLMQQAPYEYYPQDILDTMLKSLEYDYGHARTWLDAAEYAKRYLSLPQHYAIINNAALKLPEDVTILVAAMKAGGNRGAHKKASGLAKRVLEIDPINTSALDFLVESRLEHGRKLASRKKWLPAQRELQGADTRVKAIRLRGRNRICLGMLLLLQDNEEGLQHIAAGRQENGSPLLSHVLTSLESRLYQLTQARHKEFDRELRRVAEETEVIDSTEFLRLITWLLSFDGQQWLLLKETCQCLKKYFSRAVAMDWSRDEGLSICKALERADLVMALAKCSGRLEKKFPDDPEIRAWYLLAAYGKKNKPVPLKVLSTLEDLMYELAEIYHYELLERIEAVLQRNRNLIFSLSQDEAEEDDFFDSGPFRIPKKGRTEEKPQPEAEPLCGRQLNLFDDEL